MLRPALRELGPAVADQLRERRVGLARDLRADLRFDCGLDEVCGREGFELGAPEEDFAG